MIERLLFIGAAVATILGFVLELWRTWKARSDDGGKTEGR